MKLAVAAVALTASLFASNAVGDARAYYEDGSGDKIILTDEVCKVEDTVIEGLARAVAKVDGESVEGCWVYDEQSVIISWEGRPAKRYPFKMWKAVVTY